MAGQCLFEDQNVALLFFYFEKRKISNSILPIFKGEIYLVIVLIFGLKNVPKIESFSEK